MSNGFAVVAAPAGRPAAALRWLAHAGLAAAGLALAHLAVRLVWWLRRYVDSGPVAGTAYLWSAFALGAGALYCLFRAPRWRGLGVGLAAGWALTAAYWVHHVMTYETG